MKQIGCQRGFRVVADLEIRWIQEPSPPDSSRAPILRPIDEIIGGKDRCPCLADCLGSSRSPPQSKDRFLHRVGSERKLRAKPSEISHAEGGFLPAHFAHKGGLLAAESEHIHFTHRALVAPPPADDHVLRPMTAGDEPRGMRTGHRFKRVTDVALPALRGTLDRRSLPPSMNERSE